MSGRVGMASAVTESRGCWEPVQPEMLKIIREQQAERE